MTIVRLHACYSWACEECGRDNVDHIPTRTLDPGNPEDRQHIVKYIEDDLHELWMAAGNHETEVMPPERLKNLDDVMMACLATPVDRYRVRYVPNTVTCRFCKASFLTEHGDQVMADLDQDELDSGDDDDDDDDD